MWGVPAPSLVAVVAACNNSPTTPSGAAFSSTDLLVGTGATAAVGSTVTVNYTGWLYDATKTDGKGLAVRYDDRRVPAHTSCWGAGR